jgi:3-dehydroquinate dehydratase I
MLPGENIMKIVGSTFRGPEDTELLRYNPDLIELRLDLIRGNLQETVRDWHEITGIPLILTLRSVQEGGAFSGSSDNWRDIITPLVPYATYIDIEQKFSANARAFRGTQHSVIASYHTEGMPSSQELLTIDANLRAYGDIPKIVVAPENEEDMLRFLSFTLHAAKPVITSIMGRKFRHMRPLLSLFGSEWIFGHAGDATAEGQYHIRDLRELFSLLLKGN